MAESLKQDTVPRRRRSSERVVLYVEVYDELATARGVGDITQQAKLHGVGRNHWSAIRNGHKAPSADLALRVADQLAVPVKAIWHREAVTQ